MITVSPGAHVVGLMCDGGCLAYLGIENRDRSSFRGIPIRIAVLPLVRSTRNEFGGNSSASAVMRPR